MEKKTQQEILKLEGLIDNIYKQRNECVKESINMHKNAYRSRMEYLYDNLVNCHDHLYIEKQYLKRIQFRVQVWKSIASVNFQNYILDYY